MNAYEAMMKAADWIEKNPERYEYMECNTPPSCGTPGCALGWIGYFMGITGVDVRYVATAIGTSHSEFYDRVDPYGNVLNAESAVKSLRAYAEKYLAKPLEEKKKDTPDWFEFMNRQNVVEFKRRVA